ncbi:MAG: rhodanese-like domain-containing protein, partial [Pedobacter sp.]|nr:rhodanese-like domain-containing protein [Pedobacter sp.]
MTLPLLLEPSQLSQLSQEQAQAGAADLLIVDLGKESVYQQAHVPGAVHFNVKQLVSGLQPAPGKLASVEQLSAALSALGLTPDTH